MNTNLIDEANSALTPAFFSGLPGQFGTDPSALQTAMRGALPTVLGGLIQRSSEPGGISSVMDLTAQVTVPNRTAGEVVEPTRGILDKLTAVAAGETHSIESMLATGSSAVLSLFGAKAGAVVDALASYSGLLPTSASSVLSLAATILLGFLGRKMATDADGPRGMTDLLTSQRSVVRQAMPADLGALLAGIPGLSMSAVQAINSGAATPNDPMAGPAPQTR